MVPVSLAMMSWPRHFLIPRNEMTLNSVPQGGGILCQPGHCGTLPPSAPPGNGWSEVKLICLQTVTEDWMPTAQLRGITIYVSWNCSSFHCIDASATSPLSRLSCRRALLISVYLKSFQFARPLLLQEGSVPRGYVGRVVTDLLVLMRQ